MPRYDQSDTRSASSFREPHNFLPHLAVGGRHASPETAYTALHGAGLSRDEVAVFEAYAPRHARFDTDQAAKTMAAARGTDELSVQPGWTMAGRPDIRLLPLTGPQAGW